METVKLYEKDVYIAEFQAKVVACRRKDDRILAALDQTAFFPEGGGQPADTGTLGDALVLDVQEKDGVIWHTVSAELTPGETVVGTLDFRWRRRNMQNHTGEHIVSGIVHRAFGYDNVGFHMGEDAVTVDFNGPITEEQLAEIEEAANDAVEQNLPVQVSYPDREELETLDYRSKKEISGQIRIVTIPGVDVCACCGTHVSATGEVRLIKLLSVQNYKGGVRIAMLCGQDAIEDYQRKHAWMTEAMHLLSAKPENVCGRIRKLLEEIHELKGQLMETQKKLAKERLDAIAEGTEFVCLRGEDFGENELRELVNQACGKAGCVLALTAAPSGACRYILASKKTDVREIGRELNERFGGKGGGSQAMVQGTLTSIPDQNPDEIRAYVAQRVLQFSMCADLD